MSSLPPSLSAASARHGGPAPLFASAFPLRPARVHEVCGAGATAFAALTCARARAGALIWIRETWMRDQLSPLGLADFFDPSRLILARAPDAVDALAVAEEALRDSAVALVLLEVTRPLDLREGRRLQLAAKTGGATGLCLIPEGMGSNAAETRWRVQPLWAGARAGGADSTLLRWQLIKNKSGTLGAWDVCWNRTTYRLDVVSPPAQ
ncbi:ImuA family protein [Pseudooceanicola sp. 200-1SW]|uniref:ImuA family protein n=1 Tax=Pseudooceanicola sp. 200-1SW TaxID=3425949 RepID=UPI003D7F7006